MQTHAFAARTILAFAGLALAAPASHAALNYTDGDLLLAFRATSGTGSASNYVVNLGSAATFANLGPGSALQLDTELGNIKADLDAIYGATWQTRMDIFWSVSGVQKSAGNGFTINTMFATATQPGPLTIGLQGSAAWTRPNAFSAGAPAGKIQSFGERFKLGDGDSSPTGSVESSNSALALIQAAGGVNAINTYSTFMPGGANTTGATAYGFFGGATTIEGSFGNGTSGVVLDFYTVATGSGPATFEGTFTMDNNATVTFTSAVPEPSSFAALAIGAAVLGGLRRRKINP